MSSQFVSGGVLLTALAGLVIAFFYIRYFLSALQKAIRTRNDAEESDDRFEFSLLGAVISVVISASVIALYGVAPFLLYLGPIAALLSPIAVTYCLYQEAKGES